MTTDLGELWDFDDPSVSEERFRRLAADSDGPLATYASTQVEPTARLAAHHAALARARTATVPAARDRDASLLTNMGVEHAEAGDHEASLAAFEEALGARLRIGDPARARVARWMVAGSLRLRGEADRGREVQLALEAELEAIGETDPYVDGEPALLDPPSSSSER